MGLNRVYHEMERDTRSKILDWFRRNELKATNDADVDLIVKLLEQLL